MLVQYDCLYSMEQSNYSNINELNIQPQQQPTEENGAQQLRSYRFRNRKYFSKPNPETGLIIILRGTRNSALFSVSGCKKQPKEMMKKQYWKQQCFPRMQDVVAQWLKVRTLDTECLDLNPSPVAFHVCGIRHFLPFFVPHFLQLENREISVSISSECYETQMSYS